MRIAIFEMPDPASRTKRFIGTFIELGHEVVVVKAVRPESTQHSYLKSSNYSEVSFNEEMINPLNKLVRDFHVGPVSSSMVDVDRKGIWRHLERNKKELPIVENPVTKKIMAQAIRTPIPSVRHGGFANVYTLLPNWLMAAEAIVNVKPDIIWAVDLDSLPAGVWASRILKKPLVYQADELFQDLDYLVPAQRQEWLEIAETFIPHATEVITVCESASKILKLECGAQHATEILNLAFESQSEEVQDVRARSRVSPTDFLAVMIGNIVSNRGIESAIQMLACDKFLHLALVGSGVPDYIDSLKELANESGVLERLHFVGSYNHEQLCDGISSADVNLILLDPNLGRNLKHALPNKLFDGLAAGIPSVAAQETDAGQFLVSKNLGLTFPHGDSIALAKAARDATSLKSEVKNLMNTFTWNNNNQAINAILESLH
jgi:glycosyltransferase involved in cell wall biosynthesis